MRWEVKVKLVLAESSSYIALAASIAPGAIGKASFSIFETSSTSGLSLIPVIIRIMIFRSGLAATV